VLAETVSNMSNLGGGREALILDLSTGNLRTESFGAENSSPGKIRNKSPNNL
jgi:hypothetical protein